MARKPIISRTLNVLEVTANIADIENSKVYKKEFIVSAKNTSRKSVINAIKAYDNDTNKFVDIVSIEKMQYYYWMPEQDFLNVANFKKIER